MTPKIGSPAAAVSEGDKELEVITNSGEEKPFKAQIVWKNVLYLSYFHLSAVYGLYLAVASAKLLTVLFG